MLSGNLKKNTAAPQSNFNKKKWCLVTCGILLAWQAIAMLIGEMDHKDRVALEKFGATVQRGPSYGPLDFISGLPDGLGAAETVSFSNVTLSNQETGSLANLRCCSWIGFTGCNFADPEMAASDLFRMKSLQTVLLSKIDDLDLIIEQMAERPLKIIHLILDNIIATDQTINAIARLPNLRTLSIWDSKIPQGGITRLQKSNPNLIVHDRK